MTQAIGPMFTSAASATLEVKKATGFLFDAICTPSVTGFFMMFDVAGLANLPADGPVSPNLCVAVAAGSSVSFVTQANAPISFLKGCVLVFSTTGPFTKTTATGTAHISARCN